MTKGICGSLVAFRNEKALRVVIASKQGTTDTTANVFGVFNLRQLLFSYYTFAFATSIFQAPR